MNECVNTQLKVKGFVCELTNVKIYRKHSLHNKSATESSLRPVRSSRILRHLAFFFF